MGICDMCFIHIWKLSIHSMLGNREAKEKRKRFALQNRSHDAGWLHPQKLT